MARFSEASATTSDFVAGGYGRAVAGIEAEARAEIEQKHADKWNASRFFTRWLLLRQIESEIDALVAERSSHVSPESFF